MTHTPISRPPISAAPAPDLHCDLLGGLTPAQFMRRHWQKKPLLIRGAVPTGLPLLSRQQLFDLAASEAVESRLIVRKPQGWTLKHGPLARTALPPLKQAGWTLLVQGVDLHSDAIHELMNRFRYLKAHYVKLLNGPQLSQELPQEVPSDATGGRSLRPKGWQPHRQSFKLEPSDSGDAGASAAVREAAAEVPQVPMVPFTAADDEKIWATYVKYTESNAASKDMRFNAPEGTVGKLAESTGRMGGSGIQLVLNRFRAIKTHRLRLGLAPSDPMVPLPGAATAEAPVIKVAASPAASPAAPATSVAAVSVTSSKSESVKDTTSLTSTAQPVKIVTVPPPAHLTEKPFTAADDDLIWTKYNLARRKRTPEEKTSTGGADSVDSARRTDASEADGVEGMVARLVTELVAALGHSEERTLRRIQKVVEEHRTVHK